MPNLMWIASVGLGVLFAFGAKVLGPLKGLTNIVEMLGKVAVIVLALAFLGYPQLGNVLQSNPILTFVLTLAVAFAGSLTLLHFGKK